MFCIKCGVKNPDEGTFCYKCGHALFAPEQGSSESQSISPATTFPTETVPALQPKSVLQNQKWVAAYGWFFIAAGLYLITTGLITLFASQDVTPSPIAFGQAKRIGLFSAMFQGFLFVATGLAILRKMKIAVRLVWVTVGLSGLGVIFRGLIPMDIFVWVLGLLLANWFTKKAREESGVVKH
jgi:hypothetical protein